MPDGPLSPRRLSVAQKRVRALELRREGKTFQQIADIVGWKNKASAYLAVKKGLEDTMQEPADALRKLESERLDWMWRKVVERMDVDHLWAVDRGLKVAERRAALFGLDTAPTKDWGSEAGSFLAGVETGVKMQTEDLSEDLSE